jgi:hypothetical protein
MYEAHGLKVSVLMRQGAKDGIMFNAFPLVRGSHNRYCIQNCRQDYYHYVKEHKVHVKEGRILPYENREDHS